MTIFDILTMIGGLSLLLYGMKGMGDGLAMLAGGKLEKVLQRLTSNRFSGLILGALVTAVIQSSAATTMMVVGFVNSGIMELTQAVGVIMGANIGTTITAWLLSLSGISGAGLIVNLLKPSSFSPILALIGVILLMVKTRGSAKKSIGSILISFAVLMFGMGMMTEAVAPLAKSPAFTNLMTSFTNPILGLLAGAVMTTIMQSSSVSVGILQALCVTGAVSYGAAIPIIMGQNIGSCSTTLISSIGTGKNARRTSIIHLSFNVFGTIFFLTLFYILNGIFDFAIVKSAANSAGIAICHSAFNILCTIILFPFGNQLVKLSKKIIPDVPGESTVPIDLPLSLAALNERFLSQPAFAIQLCKKASDEMAQISRDAFLAAIDVINDYTPQKANNVILMEQQADKFEDVLGTYLVKLSGQNLTKKDSRLLSIMLHSINDFERISDHAAGIAESAIELHEKGLSFTEKGERELAAFGTAVADILKLTTNVYLNDDVEHASVIEPFEEVIDDLCLDMKQRHIVRLRKSECNMEAGLILEDILTVYERVSDHCSNIGICLIEIHEDEYAMHAYHMVAGRGTDPQYRKYYKKYKAEYQLP